MNIINPSVLKSNYNINKKEIKENSNKKSFKDILIEQEQENNIQFSKHASTRLINRNLTLSNSQIQRVKQGIEKAKAKGIKESLVLVDNVALVVNIKNNIVVTAIQNNNEKVYTNIDGAVIV